MDPRFENLQVDISANKKYHVRRKWHWSLTQASTMKGKLVRL